MYDHTFSKIANHQIRHASGLSTWLMHIVTLISLRGFVWVCMCSLPDVNHIKVETSTRVLYSGRFQTSTRYFRATRVLGIYIDKLWS